MTFPLKLRVAKRSLRWSGGGLLALVSIGMHGMLLGMPLAEPGPEAPNDLSELNDPAAAIDVVRLPATPDPTAEPVAQVPTAPAPVTKVAPAPPVARSTPPAPAPAAPQENSPPPPEVALEPVPSELPPPTLDERLRDPAQYDFNQQTKSLLANEMNFHMAVVPQWLEAEGQGLSDSEVPVLGSKLAPLQVVYPIGTCLVPPPAEGLVGVIVGANGQLVKEPVLLDSTGYTVLDEKALELALGHTFAPQTGPLPNPYAHWLPVQVQYDGANCTP
ncbi:MAG TPA: hypothetical protein VEZ50_02175 [Nodosilinea sp.]|nr:hypothetical protein [Nodosilinea sp.]